MMLAEMRRRNWTRQLSGGVLMVLFLVPTVVRAQSMRWPEAVAALAAERTRAETRGRLLKRMRVMTRRAEPRRARLCRSQGGGRRGHPGVDRCAGGGALRRVCRSWRRGSPAGSRRVRLYASRPWPSSQKTPAPETFSSRCLASF